MKKIIALFILLNSSVVFSQGDTVSVGPVDTSMKLEWIAPSNAVSVEAVLTFEWRLKDGTFIPVTALTNISCYGLPIKCETNLTQSNVDALNQVGIHNLTLSSFRADVGEGPPSVPFVLRSPMFAPTNLRIIK